MPPDRERICDSVVMFAFEPRIQEPLVYYVDEDEEEQEQEHEEVEEEAEELGPYVPPPFGLILLHEPRFAYVLADPVFFPKTPGQAVTVAFPDGQRMRFDYPVLHETESFFGMVCAYDSVFDTDSESIHQFEIANNLPETGQLVHVHIPEALMLTPGVVIQAIDGNFQATCIASRDTSYSAPVVNDLGQMIGMCKSVESQYVSAINNDTIAAAISRSQGLTFTTLPPVLQYLRQTYGA